MNIIPENMKMIPNVTKLIHCSICDTTFTAKKIPEECPYCGQKKGDKLKTASADDIEAFMNEYSEILAEQDGQEESTGFIDQTASTTSSSEASYETDDYEPIGYDPDEFLNNQRQKVNLAKFRQQELLAEADMMIQEKKWAMQRVGLPTDSLQMIKQDIRSQIGELSVNVPLYTSIMLKMVVDNTLQHELRHPRKHKAYNRDAVTDMLLDLGIDGMYWESYYEVAGVA